VCVVAHIFLFGELVSLFLSKYQLKHTAIGDKSVPVIAESANAAHRVNTPWRRRVHSGLLQDMNTLQKNDCVPGGYSVWVCPPLRGFKLPPSVKKNTAMCPYRLQRHTRNSDRERF
jgi:hypothetical protein